jgi:hypothetical protein
MAFALALLSAEPLKRAKSKDLKMGWAPFGVAIQRLR